MNPFRSTLLATAILGCTAPALALAPAPCPRPELLRPRSFITHSTDARLLADAIASLPALRSCLVVLQSTRGGTTTTAWARRDRTLHAA